MIPAFQDMASEPSSSSSVSSAIDARAVPCVIVIGPSGAGKSTLLANVVGRAWPSGWQVQMLPKETTRPVRGYADRREFRHITDSEFRELRRLDAYFISYDIFGESYALPWNTVAHPAKSVLYVQTFPTSVALKVKETIPAQWDVAICLLDTPPAIARTRLIRRGDPSTLATLDARMQTAVKDRASVADVIIRGGRRADEELHDLLSWLGTRYRLALSALP